MQYLAIAYLPDDSESVQDFDYSNIDTVTGMAILVPASQALRTMNRLSRDEGWEVFQINIQDMSEGTGTVIMQRPGNVPTGW